MTNECSVVRDLLALYAEGLISKESAAFVEAHLQNCKSCQAELEELKKETHFEQNTPKLTPSEDIFSSVQKKLRLRVQFFFAMLLLPGIFWGFGLMMGDDLFYNTVIMPIVGVIGYFVFRQKAFYIMPSMLLVAHVAFFLLQYWQQAEYFDVASMLAWTFLCAIFAFAGTTIPFLLHVFKNRKKAPRLRLYHYLSPVCAILITAGLCIFATLSVGNPISRALVKSAAKERLETVYADRGFVLEEVNYSFKDGTYYVRVRDPNSIDGDFSMNYSMAGQLLYDRYEYDVIGGKNAEDRLFFAYREQVNEVLDSPLYPYKSDIHHGDLRDVPGLESNRFYDVDALASQYGRLTLFVEDSTVSEEKAAEILLTTKRLLDDAGVKFHTVHFVLEFPRPEGEPRPEGRIEIVNLLSSDVYEEGLVERIRAAQKAEGADEEKT